jgi:hypothetical protein
VIVPTKLHIYLERERDREGGERDEIKVSVRRQVVWNVPYVFLSW